MQQGHEHVRMTSQHEQLGHAKSHKGIPTTVGRANDLAQIFRQCNQRASTHNSKLAPLHAQSAVQLNLPE